MIICQFDDIKEKQKVDNPEKIAKIMYEILRNEDIVDQDKEHFWVIGLNTKLNIKYIELVTLGILNSSIVHPREVFRLAVMKGVDSIILCHNHPSGDLTPSHCDLDITTRLEDAGKILGIEVVDHIIINNKGDYVSLNN